MYNGQVNVSQDRLQTFLAAAELFQIKGLIDVNDKEEPAKVSPGKLQQSNIPKFTLSSFFLSTFFFISVETASYSSYWKLKSKS